MPRRAPHLSLAVAAAFWALAVGGCALREEERPVGAAAEPPEPVLEIAWGEDPLEDPRALDPAFARGTAANVLLNVMDPLVELDRELDPTPHLAEGWEIDRSRTSITFTLRPDGRWSNGEAITAHDFEFSWKRALAPDLAAPNAERFFAIRGARDYHECVADDCAALAERVGVHALDARTLQVRLRRPDPAFPARVADVAFLAVHPASVNDLGERWTDPEEMVTNGPFRLGRAEAGRELDLVKDAEWRDAAAVTVGRVEGRIIVDGLARVQAFDFGEVDALDATPLPGSEMPALRERAEYERYPALTTYYYAFNLDTVPDVHQRRAMALAIDRRTILEHLGRGDEVAAIGLTPPATPGFDQVLSASPWLDEAGDLARAKAEMEEAQDVTETVEVVYRDDGRNGDIAAEIAASWRELGIDTRLRGEQGPEYADAVRPPNDAVDVFQMTWRYDVADPSDALRAWTCRAERNYSHYCDRSFDEALRAAVRTRNAERRNALYAEAESRLFGEDGDVPLAPIFWYARSNLETLAIRESFYVNPLGQIDFGDVEVE
ncbi:MAG: peptide ABC transporter substrate-binding protein, partial [Actinobacteria bacterium]|nr:peptide ABC transporter substrate-binding protein [Actinomycetota bacterium]